MAQRGNILFIILLAVVLFAALAYAVMGQREQAPASMHKEQANSLAAALIGEASLVEQSVMRAKVVNGIKDYGFDFAASTNSTASSNSTCTALSDVSLCRMFREKRTSPMTIPAWARTGSDTDSYVRIMVVQIPNIATPLDEVIYLRGYLRKEVCEAINRLAGNTIDLSLNDAINGDGTRNYDGGMISIPDNSGAQLGEATSGVPGVAGRNTFCVNNQSWGYMFVHVLIPR